MPELVFVVAMIAILAGMTAQTFSQTLKRTNHSTSLHDLRTMFSSARSLAITTGKLVTVCPLSEQDTCIDDWSLPISVFSDPGNDRRPDLEDILRVFPPPSHPTEVHSRTAGRGYFQFNASGMSNGSMGSLVFCTKAGEHRIMMSYAALNISGRFRVEHANDESGNMRLSWGATITCPI